MLRLLKFLREYIGEAKDEDKEKIEEDLEAGAEPNVDYFLMVALSCIMATIGLLINNVAVIIGAMLIAPLMTSIVTMALGIVRGDIKLFFKAAESEVKGAFLVIVISVFITLFSPLIDITPEISSRAIPDLFYLVIALAAGGAGAYAIARPKLNSMLPGVAIATAVLPPLATIGIGLGLKRFDIALGALLLFLTNLIGINLASTVVFWILGVGPKRKGSKDEALKDTLKKTVALLLLISIPLTWIMINTLNDMNTTKIIEETIEAKLLGTYQSELIDYEYTEKEGIMNIELTIRTADNVDHNQVQVMNNALKERLDRDIRLTVEVVKLTVYETR